MMDGIADIGRMDAAIDRLLAEDVIDRLQDRWPRAERIVEGDRIEFQPGSLELLFQFAPARVELLRGRALEREDRLFLVADCEDGADDPVARACTRSELGDDVVDDFPLPRA